MIVKQKYKSSLTVCFSELDYTKNFKTSILIRNTLNSITYHNRSLKLINIEIHCDLL